MASADYGRELCRKAFPEMTEKCEWPGGCDKPPHDRHHVDGDTFNNARKNVQFLCRAHHMSADGRSDELVKNGEATRRREKEPVPCEVCGRVVKVTRRGRCGACSEFYRRNRRERYEDGRFTGKRTGQGASTVDLS